MKEATIEDGWFRLAEDEVAATLKKPEYYIEKGCEVVRYNNRVVYRLEEDNGAVLYAKWLYPQNECFRKRFVKWVKRLFRGPRVKHIYEIHRDLLASGFGCPEPVFSAWRADELTELFVSKELAVPCVHSLLRENQHARTMKILKIVAADFRRLHQAGFVHGDAIPGNICVEEDKYKVYYLDNDRTRRSRSHHQAMRNLVQFCSHLPFYCSLPEASKIFLEAYGVSASEGNALLSAIQRRILEIIAERNKR